MNVGEVYYTQLKSNLFIPLLEKDIDGNVFGMMILANETYQDMPLFGKYDKPYQYTTTKKAIERMTKLRNESRISFRKVSSDDVNKFVPFYTPSSKMWLAVGDKYEKIISTSSSSVGKVYSVLGVFQHEEYVDYKTGKGVNPLYYPFGTDFSNLIAYVKGLAMTKSGLDAILVSIPHTKDYAVVDTYAETMFNMFANDSELASWSINNPRPYNIVVIKKDPPKFTRQMLDVEVEVEKDEKKTLDKVKKLIGDDVDEEFIKKVATLDWEKLTKLKKKNPKILEEVAKTIGNIYQTYKQEREDVKDYTLSQEKSFESLLTQSDFTPPPINPVAIKNWINQRSSFIESKGYEYKGYKVMLEDVLDGEGVKTNYYIIDPNGFSKPALWNEAQIGQNIVRLYIDLGAPDNIANESELFEAREKFLNQYEEGVEKEDVSELTEIPESWWTKIDVEDFGYDKIDSSNEILDIINKKRRSKEDKIRLVMLFSDTYKISPFDDKYEEAIQYLNKLDPSSPPLRKEAYVSIYKNVVKKRLYDKFFDKFFYDKIVQNSILSSDEYIIDIPFTNVITAIDGVREDLELGKILLVVSEINNLLISGTKKSTKPKSEIQTKYEKIDFDF